MNRIAVLLLVTLAAFAAHAQDVGCPNPQAHCWNLIAPNPAMPAGMVRPGIDAVFTTPLNDGSGSTVTWAVKAEWLSFAGGALGANDGGTVLLIVELMGGYWTPVYTIDPLFSDVSVTTAGGPAKYVTNVVQPAVRTWEASRFGGAGAAQQPSVAASLLIPVLVQP